MSNTSLAPRQVVSDVRYQNELQWLRRLGGIALFIQRDSAPTVPLPTESKLQPADFDIVIDNNANDSGARMRDQLARLLGPEIAPS